VLSYRKAIACIGKVLLYRIGGVELGGLRGAEHDMQGVVGIGGAKSMRFWGQKISGKNLGLKKAFCGLKNFWEKFQR
jgi:hypothetical protein